jgi:uncharacterized protein involved in cysteine biosynthesis
MNYFTSRLRSFWFGILLPLKSLKLILSKPKLIFWSIIPIVITLVLYAYVVSNLQHQAQIIMGASLLKWNIDPNGWVGIALSVITRILLFILGAITFSYMATVVSCPFNDFLAEEAESFTFPPLLPVGKQDLRVRLRHMAIDLLKSFVATGAALVFFLVSWIPFVNFLALIITFLLITFQFISYPQTRRGVTLEQGLEFLWKHFFACFGFGFSISLLFSLPIVASFALPLAIVGGTLLYARSQDTTGFYPLR